YRTHQWAESRGSQGGSPSQPGQHEHRSGQRPTKRETGPLKDRAVDPNPEQTTDKTTIELLTGLLAEEAELPLGRGVAERLIELFLDLGDGVAMRIDVALEVLSGLLTKTDALVQLKPSPSLGKPEMFRLPAALDLSQLRLSLHPLIRQGLSPLLEQRRELDVPSLLLHRPQVPSQGPAQVVLIDVDLDLGGGLGGLRGRPNLLLQAVRVEVGLDRDVSLQLPLKRFELGLK